MLQLNFDYAANSIAEITLQLGQYCKFVFSLNPKYVKRKASLYVTCLCQESVSINLVNRNSYC